MWPDNINYIESINTWITEDELTQIYSVDNWVGATFQVEPIWEGWNTSEILTISYEFYNYAWIDNFPSGLYLWGSGVYINQKFLYGWYPRLRVVASNPIQLFNMWYAGKSNFKYSWIVGGQKVFSWDNDWFFKSSKFYNNPFFNFENNKEIIFEFYWTEIFNWEYYIWPDIVLKYFRYKYYTICEWSDWYWYQDWIRQDKKIDEELTIEDITNPKYETPWKNSSLIKTTTTCENFWNSEEEINVWFINSVKLYVGCSIQSMKDYLNQAITFWKNFTKLFTTNYREPGRPKWN
jgi:hypothetical protein